MQHIINFAIDIEDERIQQMVEKSAEKQILDTITKNIEDVIYHKSYYGGKSNEPLRNMVQNKIDDFLKENKDTILSEASRILADKLFRSKAGKALLEELKGESK